MLHNYFKLTENTLMTVLVNSVSSHIFLIRKIEIFIVDTKFCKCGLFQMTSQLLKNRLCIVVNILLNISNVVFEAHFFFVVGYERIRTYTEGLSKTRRTLGGSWFSCDSSLGVLSPDAAFSVYVEETKSKYSPFITYTFQSN